MLKRSFALAFLAGACAVLPPLPPPQKAALAPPKPYTWRSVPIGGGGFVSGLLFQAAVPGLVYARTDVGGAYRWDAAAQRWIAFDDSMDRTPAGMDRTGVIAMALDPSDKDRLYLATGLYTNAWWTPKGGTLYSSTDQGHSFTRSPLPVKLGGNNDGRGCGERLQVDPKAPARLVLGSMGDGLWQSPDRGATWSQMAGFEPKSTTFVFLDDKSPRILAGVADPKVGLLESEDDGKTWSPLQGFPAGLMALRWAQSGRTLYVTASDSIGPNNAHQGAVLKLDLDRGALSPLPVPAGNGGFSGIDVDAQDPKTLIVSTLDRWDPGDEIYRSTDGGRTWKEVLRSGHLDPNGFAWMKDHKPHWIADVKLDPHDRDRALFVTGYGLFASRDLEKHAGSVTWAFEDAGLEETCPISLFSPPWGASLYSAIGDQSGFSHWDLSKPPSRGVGEPRWGSARSVAGSWSSAGLLVRAGDYDEGRMKGSFSTDAGRDWSYFASQAKAKGPGNVAVTTDASAILWCPDDTPCQRSTDLGQTWSPVSGLPQGSAPQTDTVTPSLAYALDVPNGVFYVSHNGGLNFKASDAAFPPNEERSHHDVRPVPGRRGAVWVALDDGLWASDDQGAHFTKVDGVQAANHLGFGAPLPGSQIPSAYLVGTVQDVYGFFRSDDGGATWSRLNDDEHQYGYIHAIVGDARVPGRVYVAAEGRGILVGEAK